MNIHSRVFCNRLLFPVALVAILGALAPTVLAQDGSELIGTWELVGAYKKGKPVDASGENICRCSHSIPTESSKMALAKVAGSAGIKPAWDRE